LLLQQLRGHIILIWDGGSSIAARSFKHSSRAIPASMWSAFRRMLRKSIPMNRSGIISKTTLANGLPQTLDEWWTISLAWPATPGAHRGSCGFIRESDLPPFLSS